MAKWEMDETKYFLSLHGGVWYVVQDECREKWTKWCCSNEPFNITYARPCAGPEHIKFTNPEK